MTSDARAGYGPTKMTSSEAFVETLVAEGITKVPGIVGSAFMDALDLFPAAGIDFVDVAHEQNAVHMADGYARVTGRPSLVISQNGPGITNFVTGVAAAYWAHTPMVVVTPAAGTLGVGLGGFQETEQLPIFSKITKWQVQVNRPERMAELLRRAFYVAKAEAGPVQVDIPRDYFYGEGEYEIYPSATVSRGSGTPEQIREAAQLLASARNPVVISGGGVVASDGVADVAALAEYLCAPVASSYLHNDSFPASHGLAVGPLGYQGSKAAMRLVSEADVVLALGCRLGLTKKISLGINGDAKATAAALLDALRAAQPDRARDDARIARIAEERTSWTDELAAWSSRTGDPLSPRRALSLIRDVVPADTIVTTDIGNVCSVSNSYLHFENPRRFLAAMSFGNCGYAYPTALGAKLAAPDKPVMAYVGDGAWGMSMAETMTAVRHGLPVVTVVWNNGQWGAEKKNQIDFYSDRYVGTNLTNPDFSAVARSMGAEGIRVDREADLQGAVTEAFGLDKPVVLDVSIDSSELGEPFRRDALKLPTRHLEKYAHLNG